MAQPITCLMLQFLAWVSDRPRSYAEVMEAWRSNCPRSSVWEDATIEGLVKFRNASRGEVILTAAGRAALQQAGAADSPVQQFGIRKAPLASRERTAIFRASDEDVS
jgi:hypothetical protein